MKVAHTPDADDAFMFYAMMNGKIPVSFPIEDHVEDIERLNQRAFNRELEVTAMSAHAYAFLHREYRILSAGASIGDGYGPVVVARDAMDVEKKRIGVPGRYTSAYLLLKLAVDEFEPVEMRFDEVLPAVKRGDVDAGLIIHEGQITYETHGLVSALSLWDWWYEKTKLPMPLGVNAIRRDVPEETQREFLGAMRQSIRFALDNVEEAMDHAMTYARGADRDLVTKFALMYVNEYTYEMPESVVRAHDALFTMAAERGFFEKPSLDILFP